MYVYVGVYCTRVLCQKASQGYTRSLALVSHIRCLIITTVGELWYIPCKTRMGSCTITVQVL